MPRFMSPVLLALPLILLMPGRALEAQEGRWSFGLKPGVSLSALGGEAAERFSIGNCLADEEHVDGRSCIVRTGVAIGGFVSYRLTPGLAIQPEFHYVQKGGQYTYYHRSHPRWFPSGGIVTFTRVLDYIEIPLLLRWRQDIGLFRLAVPTAHIGPAIAFNTSSLDRRLSGNQQVDRENDLKEHTNQIDLGIALGGGVDVMLFGSGALILEARLTMGLLPVGPTYFPIEPKQDFSLDDEGIRNRSFTIHIGYGYPF